MLLHILVIREYVTAMWRQAIVIRGYVTAIQVIVIRVFGITMLLQNNDGDQRKAISNVDTLLDDFIICQNYVAANDGD